MFRIRREQLDWFGEKTKREFVAKISAWLRDAYPECVGDLSSSALEKWVGACVEKAEHYRVVMEPDVAQLILLFMILGIEADADLPWVKETLENRDLEGIGKVRRLIASARQNQIQGIESIVLESSL